ncbi:MAG TPA: dihydrolipoamide acetyltransferase family protein [Gemmataceae bacterium]|nr:dihydrolipoamide acetyltransferase family protein [Gemmataceae bacterium]
MATAILVPRLGWSMEEGTFAGWLKQDGERVQPGDPLFVLESDKSAEQVEAVDDGILRLPPDGPKTGDTVNVGQVLAHLVAEGEATPPSTSGVSSQTTDATRLAAPAVSAAGSRPRRERAISPRARRAARELGLDWHNLSGSGRNGRIRERDVRAVAGARSEGPLIPHTTIRRTIATRMVAGVTEAAPVTLTAKIDAKNLVALRTQFKASAMWSDDLVPSYTDVIVKLTAAALRQHPLLQAQWREDGLFVPERIDIAVAVDTEAGLLAPVLRSVDCLMLRQLAARSRELIEQARAGRLATDDMRGATFTVSNLGNFGIDAFTPIIHLPQCAVLGIGNIVNEPVVRHHRIVPGNMLTLSLTFDHRVVDGAPAARFLQTLRNYLENPAPWLIA